MLLWGWVLIKLVHHRFFVSSRTLANSALGDFILLSCAMIREYCQMYTITGLNQVYQEC